MSEESKKEYDSIKSYFKYLVTLTTVFLGIIGAIASLLFYFDRENLKSNLTELKAEYSESIKRTEEIASLEVEKIKTEVRTIAQQEVTKEIERLFREQKVSQQINSKVRNEIKNNANNLIETRISESMRSNTEQLEESINISDAAIKMRIAHKSGLEALNNYSVNSKYLNNRALAIQLKTKIIDDYYLMQHSGKLKDTLASKEIAHQLKHMEIPNDSLVVSNLVKYINTRTGLNDVSYAIFLLNYLEKTSFKPFEFDLINEWHQEKKKK